jgi:Chlorophyll A-B binding protein
MQVFGIDRFRECELIHGRWAMLACLGCIWAELQTGVSWVEAGKVRAPHVHVPARAAPVKHSLLAHRVSRGGADVRTCRHHSWVLVRAQLPVAQREPRCVAPAPHTFAGLCESAHVATMRAAPLQVALDGAQYLNQSLPWHVSA